MKPVMRYQSQLLFRRSYKPNRVFRTRPIPRLKIAFYASRSGPKPRGV